MKHFDLYELLDRATFSNYDGRAWNLFNPLALEALDGLREFFNVPITVNNWWNGIGQMQFRGYRPEDCPVGAKFSEHKKGNAFDCTINGYAAEDARKIILDNQDNALLSKIMRMEDKVRWVHIDCGKVPEGRHRIYVFQA